MRRSAGDSLPTPGLPVLAGASGEAVDSSALSFPRPACRQGQEERGGGEAGGEGEGEGGRRNYSRRSGCGRRCARQVSPITRSFRPTMEPAGTTRRPKRLALTLRPRLLGQGGKGKSSCLRCTGLWTVLGDHFRNVSVCYTPWFDSGCMFRRQFTMLFWKNFTLFSWFALGDDFMYSGYMHCVSPRSFCKFSYFPRGFRERTSCWSPVFSAELGSTADHMHCVSLQWLGFFTEFLREGGLGS